MIEGITDDELEFMEFFYDPIAMAECLFSDIDNLPFFFEAKNSEVRWFQYDLFSFDMCFDIDPKLSEEDQVRLRRGASDLWCFGARKTGKTIFVEQVDLLLNSIYVPGEWVGFSSFDASHIIGVLEKTITSMETHPFFKMYNYKTIRSPNYRVTNRIGWLLESVNQNIASKEPGCFDKDVEVLTDNGFVNITKVTKNSYVASVNFTTGFNIEFHKPTKLIKQMYKGNMTVFKNNVNDQVEKEFFFTPKHAIIHPLGSSNMAGWIGKNGKVEMSCGFNIAKTQYNLPNSLKKYKNIFPQLLAYYFLFGCIKNRKVFFYTDKERKEDLKKLLKSSRIKFESFCSESNEGYEYIDIRDNEIKKIMKSFINKSGKKQITRWFLNLPAEMQKEFFSTIKSEKIQCNDKKLLDDLHMSALFAGFNARVFNNYLILSKYKNNEKLYRQEDIIWNDYVYCLEIPPHHNFIIRRHGIVICTGNSHWYQKHVTRIVIEEASKEHPKAYDSRQGAIAEKGVVSRVAGMCDFTKYSPAGLIYYDQSFKNYLSIFPQCISNKWSEAQKKEELKRYGGRLSIGYKIYVEAEICEQGLSVFDIERVRACYDMNKLIKNYEIDKKTYENFRNILNPVEKNKGSSCTYLCADIGETAPTEIIILSTINEKIRYEYNITLYGLTDKEQFNIFYFLIQKLEPHIVAVDYGDGTGRSIGRQIGEVINPENLIQYRGTLKINIDFEKDNNGNVIFKDGLPVYQEEFMSEWSVKHLKDLFYENVLYLPLDNKLDVQINSIVSLTSGNRTVFECLAKEDHLFDAFKVFSVAHWQNQFNCLNASKTKQFDKFGV